MQLDVEDGLEERGGDGDASDLTDPAEQLAEPCPDRHGVLCFRIVRSQYDAYMRHRGLTWKVCKQRDCARVSDVRIMKDRMLTEHGLQNDRVTEPSWDLHSASPY